MRVERTFPRGVVPLLVAGMLIFVITVAIGILNGTDLVDFGFNTVLAHVHAGTLGWITLSALAAATWMFAREGGEGPPRMLKTGNPQVVGSMWAFQIPMVFLTTAFAPKEALSGWLGTAAT